MMGEGDQQAPMWSYRVSSHYAFDCFLMPPLKPDRFGFFYAPFKPRILAASKPKKGISDALGFTRFGDRPSLLNKMADANKHAER